MILQPKKHIPKGAVLSILTLVAISIPILFVSSSLPEKYSGAQHIAVEVTPFNTGFSLMFGISHSAATALSIPATYATAFGFIFSYGKLMTAMSESRLLPRLFRRFPSSTYIVGAIVGYGVCMLVFFVPYIKNYLFNICMLSAFCAYSSQLLGFYRVKTRFASLPRQYHSPLGVPGAVLAFLIFLLGIISIIGFQRDQCRALIGLICITGAWSMYYFRYAKRRQMLSKDELKITFVVHVMNLDSVGNKTRIKHTMEKTTPRRRRHRHGDSKVLSASAQELNEAMHSYVQRGVKVNKGKSILHGFSSLLSHAGGVGEDKIDHEREQMQNGPASAHVKRKVIADDKCDSENKCNAKGKALVGGIQGGEGVKQGNRQNEVGKDEEEEGEENGLGAEGQDDNEEEGTGAGADRREGESGGEGEGGGEQLSSYDPGVVTELFPIGGSQMTADYIQCGTEY
jgi:hypothetical protein